MKVTILGCGTSVGVPSLLLGWGKCNPNNPLNRRQRCAVLIEKDGMNILIDSGPDIRNQLLKTNIQKIDAVFLTHGHSDHIAGLAELRPFTWKLKNKIPVFGNKVTLDQVEEQFPYLFNRNDTSPSYYHPPMVLQNSFEYGSFKFNSLDIEILNQTHGKINSLGYVFDKVFGYSTDVSYMPENNFQHLINLKLWIVEGLRNEPHESHAHFELAFDWIRKVKPKKAILTHLSWESDYDEVLKICPMNVFPGYDGMIFDL